MPTDRSHESAGENDAASVRAHEDGIAAFLTPARAARFKTMIGSKRGREKVRAGLSHHASDFDVRYATKLSSSLGLRDVEALLRAAGAPTACYVLSEDCDVDGRLLDLGEAVDEVVFAYRAAVISCIPGKLGLFSDDAPGDQWLLRRGA